MHLRPLIAAAAAAATLVVATTAAFSDSALPVDVPVSRAPGPQSEVAVAVAPNDPRVLLAGSNDTASDTMRVYSSTDGGASWSSASGPPLPGGLLAACDSTDPAVAIDGRGRQYYAFVALKRCDG